LHRIFWLPGGYERPLLFVEVLRFVTGWSFFRAESESICLCRECYLCLDYVGGQVPARRGLLVSFHACMFAVVRHANLGLQRVRKGPQQNFRNYPAIMSAIGSKSHNYKLRIVVPLSQHAHQLVTVLSSSPMRRGRNVSCEK